MRLPSKRKIVADSYEHHQIEYIQSSSRSDLGSLLKQTRIPSSDFGAEGSILFMNESQLPIPFVGTFMSWDKQQ